MPEDTTNLSNELLDIVRRSLMGGAEVTMDDLVKFASHGNGIIAKINYCIAVFDQFQLELIPPAEEGDLNQVRIVRPKGMAQLSTEEITIVSRNGETQTIEFKSSLWFDRARSHNDPTATVDQLKSQKVLHSSLKTIAAFMNSDGGTLFIGIADDGNVCGINDDFICLGFEHANTDQWELQLRSAIDSLFYEGSRVNDYIRTSHCEH